MQKAKELLQSRFIKNVGIYTISSYLNKIIPFILLPIMTRKMSVDDYGIVSMFSSSIAFFMPIIGFNIEAAILRKYYEYDQKKYTKYVFSCLMLLLGSTIVWLIIALFLKYYFPVILGMPSNIYLSIILVSSFGTLINCSKNILQAKEKAATYGVFTNGHSLFQGLLSIIAVAVLWLGYCGRVYSILITEILFAFISIIILFNDSAITSLIRADNGEEITHDEVRGCIADEIKVFGIPLMLISLKGPFLTYTDKIFITGLIDIGTTGYYTVANQFAMVIFVFAQSIALAFTPWIYRKLKAEEYASIRKAYIWLTAIITAISVLWIIVTKIVLPFVASEKYGPSLDFLPWLVVGNIFLGLHLFIVNIVYYTQKINKYVYVTASVTILNVLFNYIFIRAFGAVGAAVATMLICIVNFILTLLYCRKLMPKVFKKGL